MCRRYWDNCPHKVQLPRERVTINDIILVDQTLVFTKANIGGNGPFEFFLEELNGPLRSDFTGRFSRHSEEE